MTNATDSDRKVSFATLEPSRRTAVHRGARPKNAASTKQFAGGVRSLPAHHQPAAPSRRRVALPEREGRQGKHPKRLEWLGPPVLTRTAPGRFPTACAGDAMASTRLRKSQRGWK